VGWENNQRRLRFSLERTGRRWIVGTLGFFPFDRLRVRMTAKTYDGNNSRNKNDSDDNAVVV
jgi:hypothetical protein